MVAKKDTETAWDERGDRAWRCQGKSGRSRTIGRASRNKFDSISAIFLRPHVYRARSAAGVSRASRGIGRPNLVRIETMGAATKLPLEKLLARDRLLRGCRPVKDLENREVKVIAPLR